MRCNISVFTCVTWAAFSCSAVFAAEIELGFKSSKLGSIPDRWVVPTSGWRAEMTDENAAVGQLTLKLHKPGESTAPFGNVMRSEPAAEFAGGTVTLTAKILVVGNGRGQMWLRVDRADGTVGAFDNMNDRPILAGGWKDAKIEANIDADAATLNLGFIAFGDATLFIDDVKLVTVPPPAAAPPQSPSKPKALSPRGVENLTAAARLLSYVRFFHPSDPCVGVVSWDHFAVDLMERCEPAVDANELADRLRAAFAGIAPTVEIWAGPPEQAPTRAAPPKEATHANRWKHSGAGRILQADQRRRQQIYHSDLEKQRLDQLPGGLDSAYVVKGLGGGVSCRVPIAVFADHDKKTLPHGVTPEQWSLKSPPRLTAQNRTTRLAGVALAWGVFQHFYPYFDVVETDWDAALPAALTKAAEDPDELAYLLTLRTLIGKLHDGHGNVHHPGLRPVSLLPLALDWAGNELVIVGKHTSVPESVTIGDAILSIDGRPIADCYADVSVWISAATDGWRRKQACRALTVNLPTMDPVKLVLRKPDGQTENVELARVHEPTPNTATDTRPDAGAELSPGIVYFDLNQATSAMLQEVMPKLVAAQAIIFDLRGYPDSAGVEVLRHLIDAPSQSARWCVPIVRRPDRENIEWSEIGRWNLSPASPRLTAKIAFLTSGGAISYAESVLGIVEHYKLGEIIGSTTAGTNGNVNPFTLPGGYNVSWTGMKVLKHDGSQHHGVGIAPTIPVTRTAQGIAAGRDEVLEKAVDVMKGRIESE